MIFGAPFSDKTKLGAGLTALGIFFIFLGVMLLFDGALLALGDLLFLSGIITLIGPYKTLKFFTRPAKLRGSICFWCGVFLVLVGWPFFGILVEAFGFINLFGNFFPVILAFLQQIPFVGNAMRLPGIRTVVYYLHATGTKAAAQEADRTSALPVFSGDPTNQ